VEQKGKMVEDGRAISRELQAAQDQFEKSKKALEELAAKVGDLSRRIFKKVQRSAAKDLAEWEIPITTEVRDGTLVLVVSDALAEFKDEFKKQDKFASPHAKKEKLAAKK